MRRRYIIDIYGPPVIRSTEEEIQQALLNTYPLYYVDIAEQDEQ